MHEVVTLMCGRGFKAKGVVKATCKTGVFSVDEFVCEKGESSFADQRLLKTL